jgi:hypothetical protein
MNPDEQIKGRAEKFWAALQTRPLRFLLSGKPFSPETLHTIDSLFENADERQGDGLLYIEKSETLPAQKDRHDTIFQLGAYIGQVVASNLTGCHWVECPDTSGSFALQLPDNGPTVFPMKFIAEQLVHYTPGSVVKWGKKAGLTVGLPQKKFPPVKFRDRDGHC